MTLELGLLIFIMAILISTGLVLLILILSIPYTLLLIIAILTATPWLFMAVNTIGFLISAAIIFLGIGFIVALQHAVWVVFYQKVTGRSTADIEAKLTRLWKLLT